MDDIEKLTLILIINLLHFTYHLLRDTTYEAASKFEVSGLYSFCAWTL